MHRRTVAVMQPTYLPWLGYFELIARADVFVFLDCVQYVRQTWHSRNRLKGPSGKEFWITVPVRKQPLLTDISEIRIDSSKNWQRKHLQAIRAALGRAPHFNTFFPEVESWLGHGWEGLAEMNVAGIKMIAAWMGVAADYALASELSPAGKRAELILEICRAVGADSYYSPAGAAAYLDQEKTPLLRAGIEIRYQEWPHPEYPQQHGAFVSHLSALDAVFNLGAVRCRDLLCAPARASER